MSNLYRHDLSAMFGDMPRGDCARLAADIERHGLIEPITLWEGRIIDGWHRYRACREVGVEPRFVEHLGGKREALAFVVSKNARRRHLTEAAIVGITKKVLGWHQHAAGEGRPKTTSVGVISESTIATTAGVSLRTVQRHSALERTSPALVPLVECGDLGLQTAEQVVQRTAPEDLTKLVSPTKAQMERLSAIAAASPDARIPALLKAADEFQKHWDALMAWRHEAEVLEVLHEARLKIRMCMAFERGPA